MVGVVPVVMLGLAHMMVSGLLARRMKVLGLRARLHTSEPHPRLIAHDRHHR
jgi:hypothetical protein